MCLLTLVPVLAQDKHSPGSEPKSNGDNAPILIVYLLKDQKIPVGETVIIKFKLLDKSADEPKNDLKDTRVLVFLAPGIWQKRTEAKFVEKGIYEFELRPPQPGIYYIYVEVPSLKVKFKDLPSHKFEAVEL